MNYSVVLANQVFIMFLLLVIGYLLYQWKMISKETNAQLTNIVLNVIIPAVILSTYQMDYNIEEAKNMFLGFTLSFVGILTAIVMSQLIRIKSNVYSIASERFCVIFSNCGFMAIPLTNALFGAIGVFYCNTYVIVFNVIIWTYGIVLMSDKSQAKKSLKERIRPFLTPTMFCIFIGIVMYLCQIKFPKPVAKTVEYVASMNTPLAMIVSGVYIAQSDLLGALKKVRVYLCVVMKLFLIPFVILIVFRFLPLDETLKMTIFVVSSCPTAANSMMFAYRYQKDVERASNIFTLTTLFSIISLPLMLLLASWWM